MKRWSLFFLVAGLLVGVVAGLLLDKGVSAQGEVRGTIMYLSPSAGTLTPLPPATRTAAGPIVAYCFTAGSGIHCLPAR